ncbi:hypothetical protein BX600DRAFT_457788 [Xylariales sp. PMI_506]|nr:hypothetical protein BX600DRAFT_457788 [Xylariales sp. PMI_506]
MLQQPVMETKASPTAQPKTVAKSSWFAIPPPLATLFKRFPLVTYAANELPARSLASRELPTLYVFISDAEAARGRPSFNPSCLKWQAFLKLAKVEFRIVPSTNHASPTGALPFLIPPSSPSDPDSQIPIPSGKLEQWVLAHAAISITDVASSKVDAYQTLLDYRIRSAWLHALYLSPANSKLLTELYIAPASATKLVQTTIFYQLRSAAEAQILQATGATRVNPATLYDKAQQAFEALATALGSNEWFFGNSEPGVFDAAVFSYTHLLLDSSLNWEDARLTRSLEQSPSLIAHRNRILARCWPEIITDEP